MFIFKDIYSKFKTQFKLETVLNGVVLAMILAILIIAGLALVRPVSVVHFQKIKQLSVAPLLGEAISRIHDDESVSSLFGFEKEMKV